MPLEPNKSYTCRKSQLSQEQAAHHFQQVTNILQALHWCRKVPACNSKC